MMKQMKRKISVSGTNVANDMKFYKDAKLRSYRHQ